MKLHVKIVEYEDRFEMTCKHGGFIAEKPVSLDEVKKRAKLWVEGLNKPQPEAPIKVVEYDEGGETLGNI